MIGVVLFAACAIATAAAQDQNSWIQNPLWAVQQQQQTSEQNPLWAVQQQNVGQNPLWASQQVPSAAWPQQNYDNSAYNFWPGSGRSASGVANVQSQAEDDGSWKPDVAQYDNSNDGSNGDNGQWSPQPQQQQWNRRRRSVNPILNTLIQSSRK